MPHKYEIYRDRAGEYRVRFKFNSEVMWSSEGYSRKSSALNLIESLKKNAPSSPVEDTTVELYELMRRLEKAEAPAADRIVRIDHNSAEFKEFKTAFEKLEKAIKTSNDLGDISSEEAEVAKSEIAQLSSEKPGELQRPHHIWQMAKSTLLWIFKQAAGATVGALALAALAALAGLLGIVI